MKLEKVLEIIEKDTACRKRQDCDAHCGVCPYKVSLSDLNEANDTAIEALRYCRRMRIGFE